ncbi:MAG TPA: hypothetical protein H9809_01820 [Candidatus Blautia pullicola]|jgi:chromosome segregation ATPase|uniref:Uncharacterized protein n=1 Tax=Candidatus Blautia pullicola TaxID=2838498 RepID=A0A9D2FPR7_9FIRM|nr:hypothetical protein [Candidatus Blautia pullicola]
MGEELEFRTAVGGYRKDDVLEYVENMNDKIFQLNRAHEEESKAYRKKIEELEKLLRQEETNGAVLAQQQEDRQKELEERNQVLEEEKAKAEEKWKQIYEEYIRGESEKKLIKEKLAREILRLREENKILKERLAEAENNVGGKGDFEAVRSAVSEVQYKIAEYVNVLNKTQQKLAETYQSMNGIKKRVADKIAMEESRLTKASENKEDT